MPPVAVVLRNIPAAGRRHIHPTGSEEATAMAFVARWPAALRRSPAECAWSGCGQLAEVDLLVAVPGEPSWLAVWIGGYCVGHAVIVGIEAQAHHGGELWYSACFGGEPLTSVN